MRPSRAILVLALSALPSLAQGPIVQAFQARYQAVKRNLIETAAVMPEENYSYRLTAAQRSFGEWIEHTAMGNFSNCAAIKGEAAPAGAHQRGLTRKADLQKWIEESFAYCDAAVATVTDETVGVARGKVAPIVPMFALVSGLNEHYGNLVGYMRSKGITPPSTARAQKK